MLRGIFSLKVASNVFFASEEVKGLVLRRVSMVLVSRSSFLLETRSAAGLGSGVPEIISTRSRIFATFSRETGPSMVIECRTPSVS